MDEKVTLSPVLSKLLVILFLVVVASLERKITLDPAVFMDVFDRLEFKLLSFVVSKTESTVYKSTQILRY